MGMSKSGSPKKMVGNEFLRDALLMQAQFRPGKPLALMMWVCQAQQHVNPRDTRSKKIWETMFSCDQMKPILAAQEDMRKFNRGLKIRTEVFVLVEDDDIETFTEDGL